MSGIHFSHQENITVVYTDDFVEILKQTYKDVNVCKNVQIYKNGDVSFRTVLSNLQVKEIDFDVKYDCEYCTILLKDGKTMTLLDTDKEKYLIMPIKTLKENEDLIVLDSIKDYKGALPQTIVVTLDKSYRISLGEDINSEENLKTLKKLLGYKPNKIIDFSEKIFATKQYKMTETSSAIRLKFIDETSNLVDFDPSFYDRIKIRIEDDNIFKFSGYVFCRTPSNNCILVKESNKTK